MVRDISSGIDSSEEDLGDTLKALRGYALGFVVHALIETGLLDGLAEGQSRREIRSSFQCGEEVLEALLHYLLNEQIVETTAAGSFILTGRGRQLSRHRGWFRLFVGGYAPVLRSLPGLLRGGIQGEIRDMAAVAHGSGEISPFDAAPLVARLIECAGRTCSSILDVGCGNGQLLCQILACFPQAFGIAADPSPAVLAEAQRTVSAYALRDRVQLVAGDPFAVPDLRHTPDFILAAFTLQEILGQSGEDALVGRMAAAAGRWPSARWLVVEVDHQPGGDVIRTAYGMGYYNPYFLLHPLTRQRLLPRREWVRIFERARLAVATVLTTDPAVDPTGLELGFLLEPAPL